VSEVASLEQEQLTVEGVYRNALWSPAIAAIVGIGGGSLLMLPRHVLVVDAISVILFMIGVVSAASLIPYGIYLLVVKWLWPPVTEAYYRRVVLTAPIGAGLILFLIVYAVGALDGSMTPWAALKGFDSALSVTSNLALGVGATYVAVIELVVWRFKRRRAATGAPPPTD
jgi:hypothetical protein